VRRTVKVLTALGGLGRLGRLGLLGLLLAVLCGCAAPAYRYVADDDRTLVLKVPSDWSVVDTPAALRATGADPDDRTGWSVYYDASDRPSADHLTDLSADAPMMYARNIPVAADQRSTMTDEQMAELVLPGTAQQRTSTGTAFGLIDRQAVATGRQHGVRVDYTYAVGTTPPRRERFAAVVLTGPKRTALSLLVVHCSEACFRAHPEIDTVVTSLTLKSP
jgi:hypothetical protein